MAEAIASSLVEGGGISVGSAGLSAWDGSPASPHCAACVKNLGFSLESHRARTLTQDMVDEADLILTMTNAHKEYILKIFADSADKTYTIGEYSGDGGDVSDPYGLDSGAYERCARELGRLLKAASLKWKL